MNPYIGITDFTSFEQVQDMLKVFNQHRSHNSQHKLHVGVMMNFKTLHNLPTKWQNVLPAKEAITDIFASSEAYNCLHYADHDNDPRLWDSLADAISYGGEGIHALQLDMTWPNSRQIKDALYVSNKNIDIILQIGKNALDLCDNDPDKVVRKLADYKDIIHGVLLDKSMGRGLGMDASFLSPFIRVIKKHFPEFGIVVAGGLGPETMHLVEPLVKEFSDLSIDAQGRLRPSHDALDPIDWKMAENYLIEALQLFGKFRF